MLEDAMMLEKENSKCDHDKIKNEKAKQREQRLAKQLRENLKRRKEQSRQRARGGEPIKKPAMNSVLLENSFD
ncbi:hypothetical protein PU02_0274 [Bartonella ancashensis]|uniref:Uncharacterized protein n=2 Tax=Bartonella ancashensis TaxID=1318743 RepID=A0A0M4L7D8_9HYPH|nr:hypothetical protein PU02_0274 [Bartonella ancashensis]